MKSKDFLKEQAHLINNATETLPATFVLPELQNQDSYLQYRFGLALAAARARTNGDVDASVEDPMGENMVIIARTKEEEEQLIMALKLFGKKNASRMIASATSDEPKDTYNKSPTAPQYSRKLRKE